MDHDQDVTAPPRCDRCGAAMDVGRGPAGIMECRACGAQMLALTEAIDYASPDDAAAPTDRLNTLRVQKIASLRRSNDRVRRYFVIGATLCAVLAIQCIIWAIAEWRAVGVNVPGVALLALAVAALIGGGFFFVQWRAMGKESRRLSNDGAPPLDPPDFSRLGDGSQRVKDLENIV